MAKDNAYIERQNLIKIAEYAIKETINVTIEDSVTFENENFQVNQFLTVLDSVFVHGVKRSNRQCWKVITEFGKANGSLEDSIISISNMPNLKSNIGRLRAWIRLTLMQKKFSEYFSLLVENKYLLSQYYGPHAFMMNEESQILAGLLLSLNFADFNFCLKEQNLDNLNIIIDISRYMKIASLETFPNIMNELNNDNNARSIDQDTLSMDSSKESRFTDILDQKNYLEEINRYNNSVIADLKDKYQACKQECDIFRREISLLSNKNIELETANSQLIANFEKPKPNTIPLIMPDNCAKCSFQTDQSTENAEINSIRAPDDSSLRHSNSSTESSTIESEVSKLMISLVSSSQDVPLPGHENKENINTISSNTVKYENPCSSPKLNNTNNLHNTHHNSHNTYAYTYEESLYKTAINDLKQELLEEKANRLKYEHQYHIANKRKNELEGMYASLQKIEKQKSDLTIDLKRQLDDLKAINAEMYSKIENFEISLKHKNELVSRLEQKNRSVTAAMKELEEKYEKLQTYQSSTEDIFGKMERELSKKDQIKIQLENDLKLERELKISLQHQIQKDKLEFARKLKEISRAEDILKNNEYLHKRNEELKKVCQEQEQTLIELGVKIEKTTLQSDNFKDTVMPYIANTSWQKDDEATDCPVCHIIFTTIVRKHHCRNCGIIFCQDCSKYRIHTTFSSKPVRVCLQCYDLLSAKKPAIEEIANMSTHSIAES